MFIINSGLTLLPNSVNDEESNRLLIAINSTSLKNLNFFCVNYYDDFKAYHDKFFSSVWALLEIITDSFEFRKLSHQLLKYFETLFRFSRSVGFNNELANKLIDKLVLPCMVVSMEEFEKFEDNPQAFITEELDELKTDQSF